MTAHLDAYEYVYGYGPARNCSMNMCIFIHTPWYIYTHTCRYIHLYMCVVA